MTQKNVRNTCIFLCDKIKGKEKKVKIDKRKKKEIKKIYICRRNERNRKKRRRRKKVYKNKKNNISRYNNDEYE